jgi:hypothetical protein
MNSGSQPQRMKRSRAGLGDDGHGDIILKDGSAIDARELGQPPANEISPEPVLRFVYGVLKRFFQVASVGCPLKLALYG